MNYELAKQLKKAGFRQVEGMGRFVIGHINNDCYSYIEGAVYVPTLEELIDACGQSFGSLSKLHSKKVTKWYAFIPEITGVDLIGSQEGKTPIEAVAKLYLKLNERN